MIRRVLVSALVAGSLAGLVFLAIQSVTLLPLIRTAETYESAATELPHHAEAASQEWEPSEGIERLAYTALADILTGIGFALLLVGAFTLRGGRIGLLHGILWGLAGYATFALAPALGLPPEPPGSAAADVLARQTWWLGTAAATAAGLSLLLLVKGMPFRLAGILLLLLPHLIGAPKPDIEGGTAPAELAERFALASLVGTAVFWTVLGAASGWLYDRLGKGPLFKFL